MLTVRYDISIVCTSSVMEELISRLQQVLVIPPGEIDDARFEKILIWFTNLCEVTPLDNLLEAG